MAKYLNYPGDGILVCKRHNTYMKRLRNVSGIVDGKARTIPRYRCEHCTRYYTYCPDINKEMVQLGLEFYKNYAFGLPQSASANPAPSEVKNPVKKVTTQKNPKTAHKSPAPKKASVQKKKESTPTKTNYRDTPMPGAITLRADDVMPWGNHAGETLREIYQKDPISFKGIVSLSNRFFIPKKTLQILRSGSQEIDKTSAPEPEEKKQPHNAQKNPEQAVSAKKENKEKKQEEKTRASINRKILDEVNGFRFTEKDYYSDEELSDYIGEKVKYGFTPEADQLIRADQQTDKYHLKQALEEVKGPGTEFRDGQDKAILAVLNGKRLLVVQRTGWGKSLVYYLSIKKLREMGKGPAIIICPLLALMHNQIESTKDYHLNVKAISSDTKEQWDNVYREIETNSIDAVLISPERLGNEYFSYFIRKYLHKISLFVVDEAHCISDWGHDFRPDFRRIVGIIRQLPKTTPVLATTATANDRVVRDIKYQLGQDLEIMRGTMDRKSIYIDVLNLGSDTRKQAWLLRNLPRIPGNGIVYCLTVKDCEGVARYLKANGINAERYHAKLKQKEKRDIEQRFQDNKIKALVATIAFGMGIDKPDIAFVIHYQQPASAIAYYQQIGRAGRGINKAYAILLAGDEDNYINHFFISNAFPTENQMDEIINCVIQNPGLAKSKIEEHLGVSGENNWVEKGLNYLLVNGDLTRQHYLYYKSEKPWTCDMKRARIVSWYRWNELRKFNEYIETRTCYMKYIRKELDDPNVENCGRCANCIGCHFWI